MVAIGAGDLAHFVKSNTNQILCAIMQFVPPEDKNRLDELQNSLYARTAPDVRTRRKLRYAEDTSDVKKEWDRKPEVFEDPKLTARYENHSMSFLTKLLIASILFCIAALGIGIYLFLNGSNLISADNIAINITGPVSIPGGSPVSFDITVANNNTIDLQTVDMSVDYPDGTANPANPAQALKNTRELLGNIPSKSSVTKTVSAVIFGEENLQKEVTVTVTYSVKGSSSVFTKAKTYDVLINSSPMNMTVNSFDKITSGQEFDLKVDLKSNSQQTLRSVLLKAAYPPGFSFISSSLAPQPDNATWRVGDMPPGADRVVTIHGKLTGEDTDIRAFHFNVGTQSSTDAKSIGTQFMTSEQDVTIEKPFISLAIAVDGDGGSQPHVGQFGQVENVTITWFNNLPTAVSNVQIDALLTGTAYSKTTVTPNNGYFRSGSDDILWNQQTDPELASVAPGASGKVTFSIMPTDTGTPANLTVNPSFTLTANVTGDRNQETNVPESLASAVSKTVNIASTVNLSGRLIRNYGPFQNTGNMPPRAEQPTTYTVDWTVDNTANVVNNGQVTATLPAYVKWLGATSPSTANITYDKNSGLVTWNVGTVPTYTANSSTRKEVFFQIEFDPSITQVGSVPTLINQATFTGMDSFTNTSLTSTQDFLTTRYSTDPGYKDGDEIVGR